MKKPAYRRAMPVFFMQNMMKKQTLSLKARALKYLGMREHSQLELARKLSAYAENDDELNETLNWLEQKNYLSSQRFSEALVHRRSARYGNLRLMAELQQHQLDSASMEQAKNLMDEDEEGRALQVLRRKFPEMARTPEEKQKQYRFLQQRGFSGKAIRVAMNTSVDFDED